MQLSIIFFVVSVLGTLLMTDPSDRLYILPFFIISFALYRHVFFGQWFKAMRLGKILLVLGALLFPFFANFLSLYIYSNIGNANASAHDYFSIIAYFLLSISAALFALLYRAIEKWLSHKEMITFFPKRALALGIIWVLIFGLNSSLLPDGDLTRLMRGREAESFAAERLDWNFTLIQEEDFYRLFQKVDNDLVATGLEIPVFPADIAGPYLFISPSKYYVLYNSWEKTIRNGESMNQEILVLATLDGKDRAKRVASMQEYDYSFQWSKDELYIDVCSLETEDGTEKLFFGQFKISIEPSLDFDYYRRYYKEALCPVDGDAPLTPLSNNL